MFSYEFDRVYMDGSRKEHQEYKRAKITHLSVLSESSSIDPYNREMPRPKKDGLEKQGEKSKSNNKIGVKAIRKQPAASSNVKNSTPKTANHNHLQCSAVARPTATLPPNISLSTNTLATIATGQTVISVVPAPSFTPRNLSTRTPVRFHLQNPQVHVFRLPSSENGRMRDHPGNQEDDDVTYLYTVDSSPAQRLADEVDLTQEADVVEKPAPTKKTVTKAKKNRKRKVEEVEVTSKRKIIDAQPMCSVCDIHNDSLVEIAEQMLLGSCGHLFCAPCTRKMKVNDCEICGRKINALRKVFF